MTTTVVPTFASFNVDVALDSSGKLACVPATLAVSGPNVLINFSLQAAGYSFPDSGAICFESSTSQFPAAWKISAVQMTLVDFDGVQGSDVYTLNVVDNASGQLVPIDPIIVNQG